MEVSEDDYRERANAEAASPFLRESVMPRFARVLSGWLDQADPMERCYPVHAELRVLRDLLREHARGLDAADAVLIYEGGL